MAERRRRFLLDASALLDFFTGQAGGALVLRALERGAAISAVNLAEVFEVRARAGQAQATVREVLAPFGLTVLPAREREAEFAAVLARRDGPGLADRFWLATVRTRGKVGLTADNRALALATDAGVQLAGSVLNVRAPGASLPA